MFCERLCEFRGSRQWEHDSDWMDTEQLKQRVADHIGSPPQIGLSENIFDAIIEWKLRRQRGRTEEQRAALSDDILRKVTTCAFSIQHDDPLYLAKVRLGILTSIPGVGVGVASAILALSFPNEYGVIDFRVWKMIFEEDRRQFWMLHYIRYLTWIRECASRLGWQVQHVDFFTWKLFEVPAG